MKKVFFLLIIFLAAFFRFNNLNWDNGHHLHPDERFLTMVGNAMKIPTSITQYLDVKTSPMNPANIDFKFFVYGIFPLTINKIIAVIFNNDNYDMFTIQGRFLAALFDLFVVILVFKTTKLLFPKKEKIPYYATFFYAVAVLPIQLSHFFAVDTFLNFFMFTSFYFSLKFITNKKWINLIKSAIAFGLGLATKLSALFIFPLLFFLLLKYFVKISKNNWIYRFVITFTLFFLFAYISTRLADPYMFSSNNLLDPRPNVLFMNNIKELKAMVSNDAWFPPALQWIDKQDIIFSLINLSVLGLGVPYFIFMVIGLLSILIRERRIIFITSLWAILFFTYQSVQFVKIMRYFIFIYPVLAIIAGVGMDNIMNYMSLIISKFKLNKIIFQTEFYSLLVIVILLWPVMFSSIYSNKHSRVIASEWIYKNFENGAVIANEHWDDGLPLPVSNNFGKQFEYKELPVFGVDDSTKWQLMNETFSQSDYYILSSNRGWGSIMAVPERYPKMSKFYKDLFSGKTQFTKVAEFTSYPKIDFQFSIFNFQFEFPDDWADESFTVYDHPKVLIFKKK